MIANSKAMRMHTIELTKQEVLNILRGETHLGEETRRMDHLNDETAYYQIYCSEPEYEKKEKCTQCHKQSQEGDERIF